METTSVWRATAPASGFGLLQDDLTTDVLIVGGGITGLTLALLLAREDHSVVLLEADTFGSGSTGNSTGNLYQTLSRGVHTLTRAWDEDVTRQVLKERSAAIDFIESLASQADCGFRRCPLYLYATSEAERAAVQDEYKSLSQAGCEVRWEHAVPAPLPPPVREVLVIPNQAQFQPQAYLHHLALLASQAGARLHQHSRVIELDTKARRGATATGTVQAAVVVVATHTPKGFHVVQAEMPVHREYGIARPLAGADPGPGIFWCRGTEHLSIRTTEAGGQRHLVCVGQSQKTGDHNAKASVMALEAIAQQQLGPGEAAYRWSAQNYRSADGLPYLGRDFTNCFIATGFGTDGLVWGTVAAQVITRQLLGESPAFGELCKPGRFSPVKGGKTMLEEVGTMARALVKDYLTHRQAESLSSLTPGDSAIIEDEGDSLAAWRAPDGELFAVSSICTHLGCKVHWNSMESSWDCPCHGSRFRVDGTVIEGPALAPLKRKVLDVK